MSSTFFIWFRYLWLFCSRFFKLERWNLSNDVWVVWRGGSIYGWKNLNIYLRRWAILFWIVSWGRGNMQLCINFLCWRKGSVLFEKMDTRFIINFWRLFRQWECDRNRRWYRNCLFWRNWRTMDAFLFIWTLTDSLVLRLLVCSADLYTTAILFDQSDRVHFWFSSTELKCYRPQRAI